MTRHGLAVAALALIVPMLCLDGGFVWDDHVTVESLPSGPGLQDWIDAVAGPYAAGDSDPGRHYYRPLVTLSLQLERTVFGDWAAAYRMVNLLSHLLCALLLLRFVRQRVPQAPPWAVVVAALPFVLHPSRVETAGWISGRADLWMTVFVLLAADAARRRVLSFLTMSLSVAAMLCKETAIVLPLLLAVDAWATPSRRQAGGAAEDSPVRLGPALASAAGIGFALLLRSTMVRLPADLVSGVLARPGVVGTEVLATLGHYVQAALLPQPPAVVIGPRVAALGTGMAPVLGATLAVAVLLGALASGRFKALRGPVAQLSWFVIALLPVANILPLGLPGLASSRMLYLPMAALCPLLASALCRLPYPRIAGGLMVAWAAAFGVVALPYARAWTSDAALWHYELQRDPERLYAIERLGMLAEAAGNQDVALERYLHGMDVAHVRGAAPQELRLALRTAALLGQRLPAGDLQALETLQGFYAGVAHGGEVVLPAVLTGLAERRLRVAAEAGAEAAQGAELFLVPRARLRMHGRDYAGALALLDRAIESVPGLRAGWALRARTRALLGDLRGARRDLDAALARFGASPAHAELSALTLRAEREASGLRGDPLSRAEIALIFGVPREAQRILEVHRKATDQRLGWWRMSLRAALALGQQERARQLLRVGLDLHPEFAPDLQEFAEQLPPER